MAMRVAETGGSEGCPVIGQIEVASPQGDNITSPETELTSRWCSSSRPLEEPMKEAKQMTTAHCDLNKLLEGLSGKEEPDLRDRVSHRT